MRASGPMLAMCACVIVEYQRNMLCFYFVSLPSTRNVMQTRHPMLRALRPSPPKVAEFFDKIAAEVQAFPEWRDWFALPVGLIQPPGAGGCPPPPPPPPSSSSQRATTATATACSSWSFKPSL
jgi:hypothetical protein